MNKKTKNEINTRVYRETTLPLNAYKSSTTTATTYENKQTTAATATETAAAAATANAAGKPKKTRRDKSDLGENFIAPDGGWAWLVCIAAGLSNLSIYPILQQFGFIFREHLSELGMSTSEITSIINTQPAISACTGLLNGPMFRRYTFRQVAIAGALIIFASVLLTAYCKSFFSYIIVYSIIFGFGMGISVSASSLAINTYFKDKRRRASGFSWTITGLGPIFFPHLVTFLLPIYGVKYTVFIFAAISLHAFMAALIYQPVRHHAPKTGQAELQNAPAAPEYVCKYCELQQKKETGIFSSQYLYKDDDEDRPGYEIIEPGTPMLARANDGWYGSKLSLSSGKVRFRSVGSSKDLDGNLRLNKVISEEELTNDEFLKPNNFSRERDETLRQSSSRGNLRMQLSRQNSLLNTCIGGHGHGALRCTCAEERALLEVSQLPSNGLTLRLDDDNKSAEEKAAQENVAAAAVELSFMQKVIAFFDLDLLRDFTYVNLVAGLTIINFGELNFSILTPFILNDFGFSTTQITSATSVLSGFDILMRFLVPFITEKIPWDNRVFFLIGVIGISIGRSVVASTRSFSVILGSFVWIGMCKGVRTIFWPLIIPGYVPLKRLPAASGLQLLITGLFTLFAGPFVGLIRDRYSYATTLHCLDIMTFIASFSWILEALVRRYLRRRKKQENARACAKMRC